MAKINNNLEFVQKAKYAAQNCRTLYVMGGWGQPLNANNKKRAYSAYAYNRRADRWKMIQAASADTFGFDCICLLKAIMWGWNGNVNAANGGAVYGSNGVPDINEDGMINRCHDVSTKFDIKTMVPGEMLYMPGHAGIYIGDGLAVESTPAWANGVQITAVGNIGRKAGYNTRNWTKHGKIPYFAYVGNNVAPTTPIPAVNPLDQFTDEQLANMVMIGEFGNGAARKKALGSRYEAVQKIVDSMFKNDNTPPATTVQYTVQAGDTLTKIAKKYNTTVAKIVKDNGISNPNLIHVGQRLVIR